jgi:hypothetical protein
MPIPMISFGQRLGQRTKMPMSSVNYRYKYPHKLDLNPKSEQHKKILGYVLDRAWVGRQALSQRFDSWRQIDKIGRVYIRPDDSEVKVKLGDPRKPVSLVIPTLVAVRDTLLTYLMAVNMTAPFFRYKGTGPEDTVGAYLLERMVDLQFRRFKNGVNIYHQWRDDITYGLGATAISWSSKFGRKTRIVRRPRQDTRAFLGFDPGFVREKISFKEKLFEGNEIINIDPYMLILDPNTSASNFQRGEFVGWIERTNLQDMMSRELEDRSIFNGKFLRHIDGRSVFYDIDQSDRVPFTPDMYDDTVNPVDNVVLYCKVIPQDLDLGNSLRPEMWLFQVSGDSMVTMAERVTLDHGEFPVSISCTATDGYSLSPTSRLELCYPMQETLNWFINTKITGARRSINGSLIVDPQMVNMADVYKPTPWKIIKLRQSMFNRDVRSAIHQLDAPDVTQAYVNDAAVFMDLIHRVSGAVDSLQGVFRKGSQDVSATEAADLHSGALSRLNTIATLINLTSHWDMGLKFASHTQQFAELGEYVELTTGDLSKDLVEAFGSQRHRFVDPEDILVDYDVVVNTSPMNSVDTVRVLSEMFTQAANNPVLAQKFDLPRMFTVLAQMAGFPNVTDFLINGGNVETQVAEPETVLSELDRGNIVPLGG